MSRCLPARALPWNTHLGLHTPFQWAWKTNTSPGEPEEGKPYSFLNTGRITVILKEQQEPHRLVYVPLSGSLHLFLHASSPPSLLFPSFSFPSFSFFLPTFLLSFLLKNKEKKGPRKHVSRGSELWCCTLGFCLGIGMGVLWALWHFISPTTCLIVHGSLCCGSPNIQGAYTSSSSWMQTLRSHLGEGADYGRRRPRALQQRFCQSAQASGACRCFSSTQTALPSPWTVLGNLMDGGFRVQLSCLWLCFQTLAQCLACSKYC